MSEIPPPAPIPSQEPVKPPEKELPEAQFRALHGRILLGKDNLDPDNKSIPPVTKESLSSGSPDILNQCATNCRRKMATVEKDKLEEEITRRVSVNTKALKQDFSQIEGFDPQKAERWKSTLSKLLGKDVSTTTEADVRALFDKYFYNKNKLGNASDTSLFVEDVLNAFDNDLIAVEENIDCINFYARICGFSQDYSKTVFRHQIIAKGLLKTQPDQLVEELNKKEGDQPSRINNPNEDEITVLRFIWENRGEVVLPSSSATNQTAKPDQTEDNKDTENQSDLAIKKEDYQQIRDQINQFLTSPQTTLGQINEQLKNAGLSEITETDLNKIRTDEERRKRFIIDLILGQRQKEMVAEKVYTSLSEEEQKALEYAGYQKALNQLTEEQKLPKPVQMSDQVFEQIKQQLARRIQEIQGAIEAIPKDLIEKISKGEIKLNQLQKKYQTLVEATLKNPPPEIKTQIDALRKQIYQWEGLEEEGEEEEKERGEEEEAPSQSPDSKPQSSPDATPQKKGILARLKEKLKKKKSK